MKNKGDFVIISCNRCHKKFKIPDEKIPDVPKFSVKCPSCGEKILVNKEAPKIDDENDQGLKIEPEMHPPGSIVAFVYLPDKDAYQNIKTYLKEKGYIVSSANNIEEAVAKLELNRYDLVIFADNQDGKKILEEIDKWPGNRRRNINVIAIGDKAKTFDPNIEFLLGVNSYISWEDLDRVEEILDNSIKRHEDFLIPWKFVSNNDE